MIGPGENISSVILNQANIMPITVDAIGIVVEGEIVVDSIVWSTPVTPGDRLTIISGGGHTWFNDVALNVGDGSRQELPMKFGFTAEDLEITVIGSGSVDIYYRVVES